jgi:hypothetical protein
MRQSLSMPERIGDRAGALRLYQDFARRLRQELDAQPSAETTSLVAKLRGCGAAPVRPDRFARKKPQITLEDRALLDRADLRLFLSFKRRARQVTPTC